MLEHDLVRPCVLAGLALVATGALVGWFRFARTHLAEPEEKTDEWAMPPRRWAYGLLVLAAAASFLLLEHDARGRGRLSEGGLDVLVLVLPAVAFGVVVWLSSFAIRCRSEAPDSKK